MYPVTTAVLPPARAVADQWAHLAEVLTGPEHREQIGAVVRSFPFDTDLSRLDEVDQLAA